MPSLIKFLTIVGVLAGLVFAGMVTLVSFVEPQPREMTQMLPPAKLKP